MPKSGRQLLMLFGVRSYPPTGRWYVVSHLGVVEAGQALAEVGQPVLGGQAVGAVVIDVLHVL